VSASDIRGQNDRFYVGSSEHGGAPYVLGYLEREIEPRHPAASLDDLSAAIQLRVPGYSAMKGTRGKWVWHAELAPFTWFRVGGRADALFIPADADDLAEMLRRLPSDVPVTVLGVGSNVIVRDGGVEGVVIRLAGRPFAGITSEGDVIIAGAGALDSMVAKASAKAGIAGLEFFAGIPGTIGGALTMNAGCYGAETKDILVSARGVTRSGERVDYTLADFGYTYRHSEAPADIIWIEATFRGTPDDPEAVAARIAEITSRRELTQPIREKTGGSTFKNPPGHSSWKLVDEAGWRGKLFKATGGGAMFSELHSNFMINPGEATAADIEGLGETVRADVQSKRGVNLEWEIKRIGRPL
jgi:UDP-N-acetylmuramate dehydrogenase